MTKVMMIAVMNTKLDVVTYLINITINSNKVNILLYKIINVVIIIDIYYASIVCVLLNNTFYKINK